MAVLCGMPTMQYSARSEFLAWCVQASQGNDLELIPTVKMQTRHPVNGSFG